MRDQGPGLDRVIQAQIGDKLRAMYGELTDQPVPDRLTAILSRIGAAGRETGS
ncbi:NepR family anti-sigma factor [uncultured Enterovirga sp.]|uniref:NepR family anti-sigma factor n=1 Tax=uncultured Enterovirga sp. TaxID=2026352 RepID=UPI0035CA3DBF